MPNSLRIVAIAFVLALLLSTAACYKPMPNEEIIRLSKQCTDAGLNAKPVYAGMTDTIAGIQCAPKLEN
jgi:hypothetical protein